ncbi:unnamed protein product [Cylicocyclus nassatus]|uniref:Uncharacterized protein n=1 Tax=Cylicocyclus nassatus TaxID=53992 RepID=A0AA36H0C2_CYLNA|nr:unnamed protein product [Cylicocyclus nassatus]
MSLLICNFHGSFRAAGIVNEFFWEHRYFLANGIFASGNSQHGVECFGCEVLDVFGLVDSMNLALFVSAVISALLSSICYLLILLFIRKCALWTRRQAILLVVQISGLVLSLLIVSVFYLCCYLPFTKKTPFAPFVAATCTLSAECARSDHLHSDHTRMVKESSVIQVIIK